MIPVAETQPVRAVMIPLSNPFALETPQYRPARN